MNLFAVQRVWMLQGSKFTFGATNIIPNAIVDEEG